MPALTSPAFVEKWRRAGLGTDVADLVESFLATRARIESERRAAVEATATARTARAEHIAYSRAGDLPALPDPVDFDSAQKIAERDYWRAIRALGDTLTEELAAAHDEILLEGGKHVPAIGSLATDQQAVDRHTTTKAREAWTRLGALWRDRKELLELFGELLVSEAIPDAKLPAEKAALSEYRRFARPHGANTPGATYDPRKPNPPDALAMARLVRQARQTKPGVYRLDEARAHRAAYEAEQIAETHLQQGGWKVSDPHRAKAIASARGKAQFLQ